MLYLSSISSSNIINLDFSIPVVDKRIAFIVSTILSKDSHFQNERVFPFVGHSCFSRSAGVFPILGIYFNLFTVFGLDNFLI